MKNDCLHPVFDPFEVKPTSHPDTFCSMIASTVFWITVIVIILCCRYIILQQIMNDFDCFIFQESMFANIHTRKPASQVRSRKYLFKPRANWTSPPTYNPVWQWLPVNCNAVCSHCRTREGGREASQREQRSWVVRAWELQFWGLRFTFLPLQLARAVSWSFCVQKPGL